MGTSRDGQQSQEEDEWEVIIPWDFAPYSLRQDLITRLNPVSTLMGNDWRMLADGLGYTTRDIKYIESEKENNTTLLFKQYDTKPGASVNQVFKVLENMNRKDCLDIIEEALPGMHQAYMQAKETKTAQAVRTPEYFSPTRSYYAATGSPHSYPCLHHPTSSFGSPSFYPCSHNYPGYGSACLSHHSGACGSPCQAHPSHQHHSMCQPFSSPNTLLKSCDPGFPSLCQTTQAAQSYQAKPQVNCYGNGAQPFAASSPNYPGNSPPARYNSPGFPPGNASFPMGYLGCPGSPTYNINHNTNQEDNMMVNSDLPNHRYRHMPSLYHQEYNLNNGFIASNVPVAFSENLYKHLGNNEPLPNNIVGRDDSSIISSDSSSNNDSLGSRQKMSRQFSDECNITQVMAADKRSKYTNNRETIGSQNSGDHGATCHSSDVRFKHGNNQIHYFNNMDVKNGYQQGYEVKDINETEVMVANGALSQPGPNKTKNSLTFLEQLATVPDQFKPTNEYKTFVVEQQIEVNKHRKEKKVYPSPSSENSNELPLARSLLPSVVNVKQEPSLEKMRQMSISNNPTSKSTEQNQPYRDVKVFVTYSCDNERHCREVLSLCKFLRSNGFACCVDIREEKNSEKYLQQLEWCRSKFLEADFVLACISPKYLEDISPASSALSNQSNQRQFHTQEIYEMMNSEYLNNQHNFGDEGNVPPHRFIPLLFQDMTDKHVPAWMINGPVYVWPKQYKDLAFMLTKPEERIRRR